MLTRTLKYLSVDCHRAVAAAEEAEEAAVLQPEESTILQPEESTILRPEAAETLLLHLLKVEGDAEGDSQRDYFSRNKNKGTLPYITHY